MTRAFFYIVLIGIGLSHSGCQSGKLFSSGDDSETLTGALEAAADIDLGATTGRLLIDPDNTQITFKGKAGPITQAGSFQRFSGFMDIQSNDPTEGKLEVQIEMDSVKTRINLLTRHLKSDDFFDVKKFPTSSFISTGIESTENPGEYSLNGRLTLHGVTRHVKIPAKIQIRPTEVLMELKWDVNQTDYRMEKGAARAQDVVPITVTASLPRAAAE